MRDSKFIRRAALALSLPLVLAHPLAGRAAEATQAEADRLRSALEEYIGRPAAGAPRLLEIRPKGEAYELDFDLDALLAPLVAGTGVPIETGHVTGRLIPQTDGTWRHVVDGFPTFSMTTGTDRTEAHYDGLTAEGIFDPSRLYFTTTTMRATRLTARSNHPGNGEGPSVEAVIAQDGIDFSGTAKPAASGTGVDVVATQKVARLTESVETSATASVPAMTLTLGASDYVVDMRVDALRNAEILDLWKWFVAHGGSEGIKTDPTGFKQRVLALGPLFERFDIKGRLVDFGVETPFGIGGAKQMSYAMDGTGLGRDGRIAISFTVSDFKLFSMLLPGWTSKVVPTDVTLNGSASGWSLGEALALALELNDPARPHPPTAEEAERIRAAVLPKRTVAFDYAGTRIRNALYDVTIDGHMDVVDDRPKGEVTIRATGVDDVARALAEPRDPNAQKLAATLAMASAMATRDGAAHVWRLTFDGDAVNLNGMPLASPKPTETAPSARPPEENGAAPVPAPTPAPKGKSGSGEPKTKEKGGGSKKLQQNL